MGSNKSKETKRGNRKWMEIQKMTFRMKYIWSDKWRVINRGRKRETDRKGGTKTETKRKTMQKDIG